MKTWHSLVASTVLAVGCQSAALQERVSAHRGDGANPPTLAVFGWRGVRVDALDEGNPPVFVVRGSDLGPDKLVFLHGMCGHGLGYAQSFQHASARKGTLIAPQADIVCGEGPGAKWSQDVAALDTRIVAAFKALGASEPIQDICVIGMSQGATRAAALARTFPQRYSRLVSMGAPTAVDTTGLGHLRAAVLMVGSRERKDLMLASERALQHKKVPAKSLVIPDADHAGMGPTPEQTMSEALDWLWSNSRSSTPHK
jgi:pimeloyl-ACP methyl ester carboxylesterase